MGPALSTSRFTACLRACAKEIMAVNPHECRHHTHPYKFPRLRQTEDDADEIVLSEDLLSASYVGRED
jgi:hypothetical protein